MPDWTHHKEAITARIITEEERQKKWDHRFLDLAKHWSQYSKDPSTKTGAVITDGLRPVSFGYNGLPMGVIDRQEWLENREIKYKVIVHCERNAIIFAGRDLRGCTLYVWPFMPCATCASIVIQAGIKRVVAPKTPPHLLERWAADFALTEEMFHEAGVRLVLYDEDH